MAMRQLMYFHLLMNRVASDLQGRHKLDCWLETRLESVPVEDILVAGYTFTSTSAHAVIKHSNTRQISNQTKFPGKAVPSSLSMHKAEALVSRQAQNLCML